MISASDLRQGAVFKHEGILWETVQFHHIQRPRLAPLVRIKMRNIKQGTLNERTFSPSDKFDEVSIEERKLRFSYSQSDTFHFMDTTSYEQYEFSKEQLAGSEKYLKEESEIIMMIHEGDILGIKLPNKVELAVTDAPPGIKGDTAGNVTKPVTLESGAVVDVPLFINEGDVLRIDTRTGEYIERVKK
ncbi:MAG TPA: elongation factor P [bacterium]|nr:elongation factor P [bacterium]